MQFLRSDGIADTEAFSGFWGQSPYKVEEK